MTAGAIQSNSVNAVTFKADGAVIAGALVAQNQLVIGGSAVGQATVRAFTGSEKVFSSAATRNSFILLKPLSLFQGQLFVGDEEDGAFTIFIPGPPDHDVVVAYLIIN